MLFFFFFNDTATTEIYTLSLHDALPISFWRRGSGHEGPTQGSHGRGGERQDAENRHGLAHAPFRPRVLWQAGGPDQAGGGPQRDGREGGRHGAHHRDPPAVEDQALARGRSR